MKRLSVFLSFFLFTYSLLAQQINYGDSTVIQNISAKTSFVYNNHDKILFFLTKRSFVKGINHGSNITGYILKDTINRIVAISTMEKGVLSAEYFFDKTTLIYSYQNFEYFEEETPKKRWKNFKGLYGWESRYYFGNGKLKYQVHSGRNNLATVKEIDELKNSAKKLYAFVSR